MRETTSSARKFAQNLSKTFKKQGIKTVPSPVRSAGFMVLQAPDIPSVLVELGFVSNAQEAQKLSHSAYQTDLAQTIAKAIETYFKE